MKKTNIYISVIILLCAASLVSVSALGKQDTSEYQEVEGTENWQKTIDLSEAEPGEYNLIVKGVDNAGNVGYAGPFNIMVDPDSSIPGVSISYPVEGERLGAGFSVVGGAWDDDAVQKVELAIDQGEFRQVKGTEYWSWHYESGDSQLEIPDGPHTIRVRTVDIDGNTSPEETVDVNIDTSAPLFSLDSIEEASIVSGKIEFRGTVEDLNGIESASLRIGERIEGEELSLKKEKDSHIYNYTYKLDTRDLADGPQLVRMSAEDRTGSIGQAAFLIFVDNTAPEISFLYPSEEPVNGRFTLVGRADDIVGIETLSFEADNGEEGDIELQIGNSLWTQTFDYTGERSGEKEIRFSLSDTAGNTITEEHTFQLEAETDLPLVFSSEYEDEALLFQGVPRFSGWAEDDDGPVSAVEYTLSDEEWQTISANGSWGIEFPELISGEYTLKLRAVDDGGVVGNEIEIPFQKIHSPAKISLGSYSAGEESGLKWRAGRVFAYGEGVEVQGTVDASYPDTELFYRFGDGEEKKSRLNWNDEKNLARFSIELPAKEEPGRHELHLRLLDTRQRETKYHTAWYRQAAPDDEGNVSPIALSEDLLFRSPTGSDRPVLFSGMRFDGWVPDGEIKTVSMNPDTPALQVEKDGRFFSLLSGEEASLSGLSIQVETKTGKTFRFRIPSLTTDEGAPRIFLYSPDRNGRVKEKIQLSGEVRDGDAVKTLECVLSYPNKDEGLQKIIDIDLKSVEGKKGTYRFEKEISLLSNGESGPVHIFLRAVDPTGNSAEDTITLFQDTKAPEFHLVVPDGVRPEDSQWVGEQTVVCGYLRDDSHVSMVHVAGKAFPVKDGFFQGQVNFSAYETLPETLLLEVEDQAANLNTMEIPLDLDISRWKPEVTIRVPAENSAFTGPFSLSGSAVDSEGVEKLEYRINGGEWESYSVRNSFSIPIAWSNLKADVNTITVRAVDINGYMSEEVVTQFKVSTQEPKLFIEKPSLEAVVRGEVTLEGYGEDENGIASVDVSFDNGNTFQAAEVHDEKLWSYQIDSRLLADGSNPVLIRVEDGAGVSSYFSSLLNVDNTPPSLEIRSPEAGEICLNSLNLEGRVDDSVELKSIHLSLTEMADPGRQSFSETQELSEEKPSNDTSVFSREYTEGGVLLKDIDISNVPRGSYLFNLSALDSAGNKVELSRPIELLSPQPQPPRFTSPFPGEELGPFFPIHGEVPQVNLKTGQAVQNSAVTLLIDGNVHSLIEVEENGRFSAHITPDDDLSDGTHQLALRWENSAESVESDAQEIFYRGEGLWLKIDSIHAGERIGDLSVISGTAGYFEIPPESFSSQKEKKEYYKVLEQKLPERVEISFDEGRSFQRVNGTENWSYKVYSQNHPEGEVRALIRAVSESESVYSRVDFTVDTTPPQISLYEAIEDGRYNESLYVSGNAFDTSGIVDLKLGLRPGDKSSYSTPSFIQGMYFDATALGATWFTSGMGMTFMEDNVKLQLQYGYAPEGYIDPETGKYRIARFGGNVLGSKLLANIFYMPFDYLLGPAFQQLSASIALGANFSYFNNPSSTGEDDWGIILAGVVGQFEFVKYQFRERRVLKYISAFAEGQIWLISSDVEPDVSILPSFGVRVGLF